MRHLSLLPLLVLVACGPSEEDFFDTLPVDLCAYAEECTSEDAEGDGDPIEATCEEGVMATLTALQGDDTCTYDKGQAQACLDAITEATCDDDGASSVESACTAVYSGDACNLTLADYL